MVVVIARILTAGRRGDNGSLFGLDSSTSFSAPNQVRFHLFLFVSNRQSVAAPHFLGGDAPVSRPVSSGMGFKDGSNEYDSSSATQCNTSRSAKEIDTLKQSVSQTRSLVS